MTPFKSNQQLDIEKKEKEEQQALKDYKASIKQQTQTAEPLLEFKLNQPQVAQQKSVAQIYPSPYVPVPNPYYPMATNIAYPWQFTPNNVPIIKNYNITLGGPGGDITKVANLYEDVLPSDGNAGTNTFNTLKERMILHHYIRGIFVKTGDGEKIMIGGGPKNTSSEITNLLSHIKLLEINPYHFSRQTDNPYKTLPTNFVIYRSCYPIKMGSNQIIECAKSSIGINIRIYLLSKYDENINQSTNLSRYKSDIWRELDYYQYIREEIIKPNISPNFITLHSYYMTKNTGIDFNKFAKIRNRIDIRNLNISKANADFRNKLYIDFIKDYYCNNKNEIVTFKDLIDHKIVGKNEKPRPITDNERKQVIRKRIDNWVSTGKLAHYLDSEECLVMLSEAPTQNLYDWATRTYQISNGPIRKMVQNGYHNDKVWESIIFQLLISMLIMFDKKIMFTEFTIQDNVYIKDLRHNEQNIGIWRYIYNGTEYFIPNYGYLLLIDSNFAEIKSNPNQLSKNYDPTKIKFRIKSTLMQDTNDNGEIYELCIDKMIDVFSSNNFSVEFTRHGGIPPTKDILNKLEKVKTELLTIKNRYFNPNFNSTHEQKLLDDMRNLPMTLTKNNTFNLVHSRIGTPIKDQEKMYLGERFDDVNTKEGAIVARKNSNTFNTFAIYLGRSIQPAPAPAPIVPIVQRYKILTTNNPIFGQEDKKVFIEMEVDQNGLLNYFGQPEHSYEPGKQYNILETYLISLSK